VEERSHGEDALHIHNAIIEGVPGCPGFCHNPKQPLPNLSVLLTVVNLYLFPRWTPSIQDEETNCYFQCVGVFPPTHQFPVGNLFVLHIGGRAQKQKCKAIKRKFLGFQYKNKIFCIKFFLEQKFDCNERVLKYIPN